MELTGQFRYSILPALLFDGILHVTVIQGAYTELKFTNLIKGVLLEMNPFPGKNSVLVMDNAVIHKSPELREMVEEKYGFIFMLFSVFLGSINCFVSGASNLSIYHHTRRTSILLKKHSLGSRHGSDSMMTGYALAWRKGKMRRFKHSFMQPSMP